MSKGARDRSLIEGIMGKIANAVRDTPPVFIDSTRMDETIKMTQALSQAIDAQLKSYFSVGAVIQIPHTFRTITVASLDSFDPDPSLHTSLRYRDPVSEVL